MVKIIVLLEEYIFHIPNLYVLQDCFDKVRLKKCVLVVQHSRFLITK